MKYLSLGLVVVISLATPALADYYYYGVADDDFLGDNETLWAALEPYPEWDAANALLRDNWDADDGIRSDRDSVYDDLEWYADNLVSGDVFLFAYFGHGGWTGNDNYYPDEGNTAPPSSNDPTPDNDPPYEYDEFFGYSGGTTYLWDDDLREMFTDFDSCVQVNVISGACHSGGWVGGSHDMDTSAPATNNGLYAILGAPEHGTGIGVKEAGETYYEILLTTALSNALDPFMTMSDWYDAATEYGETAYYLFQMSWDSSPQQYYYWPDETWVPTTYEDTYWTDHWGWEEEYLQLRPISYSSLDTAHDNWMGTPEPGTIALFGLGLAALGARLRRRKAS